MNGYLKVACHVHSDWSYDGKWSIPDLAQAFSERGYQVVLMTEHDRGFSEARRLEHSEACARASSDKVLVIPGIEYSDSANIVHTLVWGPVPFLGEGLPTGDLLKQVETAGGIAVLAHPSRRDAWKRFDPSWVASLSGVEVWNRKTDGWAPSTAARRLVACSGLSEFVGLDFHDRNQFFPLALRLDISGGLAVDGVINRLKAKRFQAHALGLPLEISMNSLSFAAFRIGEACRFGLASSRRWLRKGGTAPISRL